MKKILLWVGSIFMILSAIVYFPSIASILMMLSAIVLLPLSVITKHYHRIITSKTIRICLAIVLIIASFLLAPVEDTTNELNSNLEIIDTTITETQTSETEPLQHETDALETEPLKQETEVPETEPSKQETEAPETAPPKQETEVLETEPPKQETEAPETETQKQEIETPENSTLSIHFIDVGQADAALVECDGHYMLIDGGNKGDSNIIYAVLKNEKVPKLDIVIATHGHEDHVGGIPGAFNYTTADITLCPITEYDTEAFADFKKYATTKGSGITIPSVGDTYLLGSAEIKILGVNSTKDANNCSIVLMITYGETKFLFTGDAEREAEQIILNSGVDLSATVLKVGHHGSEDSTTYPFLREIMPQYAVISVGDNNSYGHPTENTLSRLRDADVKVYRTDMQGDIYCTSDGKNVVFSVEKNENADTLTNPEKASNAEPTPPQSSEETTNKYDYVLNTKSEKFHYPSCSSVKQMSEKNKAFYTGTRDELISQGYKPCGNCNP